MPPTKLKLVKVTKTFESTIVGVHLAAPSSMSPIANTVLVRVLQVVSYPLASDSPSMNQSLLLTLLDARQNSRHVEGVGLGP
jgi:hypothetical protein